MREPLEPPLCFMLVPTVVPGVNGKSRRGLVFCSVVVEAEFELHHAVENKAKATDLNDADFVWNQISDMSRASRLTVVDVTHRVAMDFSVKVLNRDSSHEVLALRSG